MSEILVYSPNHIGDVCMAMGPVLRKIQENKKLIILSNKIVAHIWRLHSDTADRVVVIDNKHCNPFSKRSLALRGRNISQAFLLSPSFRAAWVAKSVGAKKVIGEPSDYRWPLITEARRLDEFKKTGAHRQEEYSYILGVEGKTSFDLDRLPQDHPQIDEDTADLDKLVGIFPGSARGPSKQWPKEHFANLIQLLRTRYGLTSVIFGGPEDIELGENIKKMAGLPCYNMCGRTTLPHLAALLAKMEVVVGNDSGGVHLASIVGTAVVSIFGLTDPKKTRPVGEKVAAVESKANKSEEIKEVSAESARALESIAPSKVVEEAAKLLH